MEEWKDVKGYEGIYKVSKNGEIKSLAREIRKKERLVRNVKDRILLNYRDKRGYNTICLAKDRKNTTKLIHRIVAESFIPNPKNKPQVNHINEIKHDNRVENLEWTTSKENVNHGTGIERRTESIKKKIMGTHVSNGTQIAYNSILDSEKDGFNSRVISKVCKKEASQHFGYKWEYVDEATYTDFISNNSFKKPIKMYEENNIEGTRISSIIDKRLMRNNKSGIVGVRHIEKSNTWSAYLSFKGKLVLNKRFQDKQDAINARKKAEDFYFKPMLDKYSTEHQTEKVGN